MTTRCGGQRAAARALSAGVLASVLSLLACFPSTPGVEGTSGTAPAPNTPWTPVRAAPPPAAAPPFSLPPDVIARAQELKLADVVDIALRNSTLTSAAWAQARAAAATYGAARGQYYPSIAIGGAATKTQPLLSPNIHTSPETQYGPEATLSWLLLDFGGRSGAVGEAREALVAADWTHNATIQNVVLAVESAYFTYMATKSLLVAQQTTFREAQANLTAAEERHNVGVATIADVLQAKTAKSQAELAVETTEGALQTTRGALALSMGLPANIPYDIDVPPPGPLPLGITDSLDALIEQASRARPDLLAVQAQVRAAQARMTAARGAALPRARALREHTAADVFESELYVANGYTATIALQFPISCGVVADLQREGRRRCRRRREAARVGVRTAGDVRSVQLLLRPAHGHAAGDDERRSPGERDGIRPGRPRSLPRGRGQPARSLDGASGARHGARAEHPGPLQLVRRVGPAGPRRRNPRRGRDESPPRPNRHDGGAEVRRTTALCAALLSMCACSHKSAGGAVRVPVTVGRATLRAVPYEIAATGTVEPRQTARVESQVTGILSGRRVP